MKGFEKKPGLPDNPFELYHFFLRSRLPDCSLEDLSDQYKQAILEACQMIRTKEEKVRAFHDFYVWFLGEREKNNKTR